PQPCGRSPPAGSPWSPASSWTGTPSPRWPGSAANRTAEVAAAIPRRASLRVAVWGFPLILPLLGLWLLLAQPHFDIMLEHHGIHFALVVGVAAVNVALGVRLGEGRRPRADARMS